MDDSWGYIYIWIYGLYIYYIYIISWFIIYGWLADQLVMSLAEWTVRWCSHWNLPNLVICYSSPWKITMLLIGKPSINGPFSMAMLNNQRVVRVFSHMSSPFSHDFLVSWWWIDTPPAASSSSLAWVFRRKLALRACARSIWFRHV